MLKIYRFFFVGLMLPPIRRFVESFLPFLYDDNDDDDDDG